MIGIYGGTFDPIHYGHLRPVLEVCEALEMSQVRFIPCGTPPHRESPKATPLQRLSMVRAAIGDEARFVVDDREIRREGPSYMVDTLRSLRGEYGETPLCLILGMDAYRQLDSWYEWQGIPELAHIVVMRRPGAGLHGINMQAEPRRLMRPRVTTDPRSLLQLPAGKVYLQDITQLAISATHIRQSLSQGGDIRYLVPEAVRELILRQHIYG